MSFFNFPIRGDSDSDPEVVFTQQNRDQNVILRQPNRSPSLNDGTLARDDTIPVEDLDRNALNRAGLSRPVSRSESERQRDMRSPQSNISDIPTRLENTERRLENLQHSVDRLVTILAGGPNSRNSSPDMSYRHDESIRSSTPRQHNESHASSSHNNGLPTSPQHTPNRSRTYVQSQGSNN